MGSTALDGIKHGYQTFIITDATKSVSKDGEEAMRKKIQDAGVIEIASTDVISIFD